MMFIKNTKRIISAVLFLWLLQSCSSHPVAEISSDSAVKKSESGDRLYRKAPLPGDSAPLKKSPSSDLDGGISGSGHDKNPDKKNVF